MTEKEEDSEESPHQAKKHQEPLCPQPHCYSQIHHQHNPCQVNTTCYCPPLPCQPSREILLATLASGQSWSGSVGERPNLVETLRARQPSGIPKAVQRVSVDSALHSLTSPDYLDVVAASQAATPITSFAASSHSAAFTVPCKSHKKVELDSASENESAPRRAPVPPLASTTTVLPVRPAYPMATVSQMEVPRFSGSGNEKIEMFTNACRLAFLPQKALYPSKEDMDLA